MSTMMGNMRRVISLAAAGAVMAIFAGGVARADVASDRPGAVLIFPKIVVDTNGDFGPRTDTEIQLTNTSNSVIGVQCFLVDATSHCSNTHRPCTAKNEADGEASVSACNTTGGVCVADTCSARNFVMTLTKRQPITWKASEGLSSLPCDGVTNQFCKFGSNGTSSIPGVQENPFFGEMKCVEVDPATFVPIKGLNPVNNRAGDLKAEVTIVSGDSSGRVDARKYNAIAFEATAAGPSGDPLTLVIGGSNAEYNGGPNILIVDHFFDDAVVSTHLGALQDSLTTDLTLVPVTEDLSNPDVKSLRSTTLQFLVFNEFEQRFSTSTSLSCWREVQLSDIDTRVGSFGNQASIFNYSVQGTLSGQTRIRSVADVANGVANTVVGVTEEFWDSSAGPDGYSSTASNIHFAGVRDPKLQDTITLQSESAPGVPNP